MRALEVLHDVLKIVVGFIAVLGTVFLMAAVTMSSHESTQSFFY